MLHSESWPLCVIFPFSQAKQAEALTKKQEERNKAFIPPKEKPLMKKSAKGRKKAPHHLAKQIGVNWKRLTLITCSFPLQLPRKASWTSTPSRRKWKKPKPRNWGLHRWTPNLLPAAAAQTRRRRNSKAKANHSDATAAVKCPTSSDVCWAVLLDRVRTQWGRWTMWRQRMLGAKWIPSNCGGPFFFFFLHWTVVVLLRKRFLYLLPLTPVLS